MSHLCVQTFSAHELYSGQDLSVDLPLKRIILIFNCHHEGGEGGGGKKEKWGKSAKSKALSQMHTGKGQPVHPKLNPKMNRIEYLKQSSIECKQCRREEGFV